MKATVTHLILILSAIATALITVASIAVVVAAAIQSGTATEPGPARTDSLPISPAIR